MEELTSQKASRKIRNWILIFTIFLFTAFSLFGILRYKLWYNSIITDNIIDESLKSIFSIFSYNFQNQLLYYFILVFVAIMIFYCITAFVLSELLLISNKVVKKIIFKDNLREFENIQKTYLSKHYKILQAIIILLFAYIVYSIYSDNSISENSDIISKNIMYVFIMTVVIISAIDLAFKNLRIRKLKLSNEMIKSIFQFNVFNVLTASVLLIVILNVIFPLFINSMNIYVIYVKSNLSELYNSFNSALLSIAPQYYDNYIFNAFETEILARLDNIHFDESVSVISISSIILYSIVSIFGIIILIPQIKLWGKRKMIVISIGLIVNLFLTKYFIKYLYIAENADNNLIVFILLYFFFMVVFKVVVDQVEQLLTKRIDQNKLKEE